MIFDFLFIPLLISIQICTYCQNDSVEFVRLEELKSPSVVGDINGEEGLEW